MIRCRSTRHRRTPHPHPRRPYRNLSVRPVLVRSRRNSPVGRADRGDPGGPSGPSRPGWGQPGAGQPGPDQAGAGQHGVGQPGTGRPADAARDGTGRARRSPFRRASPARPWNAGPAPGSSTSPWSRCSAWSPTAGSATGTCSPHPLPAGRDQPSERTAAGRLAAQLTAVPDVLISLALWFAYEVVAVSRNGQTSASGCCGIKVVRLDGTSRRLRLLVPALGDLAIPNLFCPLRRRPISGGRRPVVHLGPTAVTSALHDRSAHDRGGPVRQAGGPARPDRDRPPEDPR